VTLFFICVFIYKTCIIIIYLMKQGKISIYRNAVFVISISKYFDSINIFCTYFIVNM
jgi:hypothetical protein